jgi:hypothetical protein
MSAGDPEFDQTKIYKYHYTILGHFLGKSKIELKQMGEKTFLNRQITYLSLKHCPLVK